MSRHGQPDPIAMLRSGMSQLYMQQIRTRQRLYALEAEMALSREDVKPALPIEFCSQFGEDLMIWDLLGRQRTGFFIEVGAFDGYEFSVTYALESVGWKGLLIEAIPERYEQCKARRPHSRVVNAAVSRKGSTGTAEFVVCEDQHGGMLSYMDKGTEHAQSMKKSGVPSRKVKVPLTTLDDLLADHTGPIDAAVIDVEGVEIDVLSGFDLSRWKPRVLILEDNSRGRDPALATYMKSQPYIDVGWVEVNRVYIHKDAEDIKQRVIRMNHYS